MISWYDGVTWDRRAYWGEDLVWAAGSHSMGALPAAGEWVRLEIRAATVGLAGKSVKGMKFSVHSGKVWFDRVGLEPGTIAANSTSPSWSDRLRELGTLLTYGRMSHSAFRYQSTPTRPRASFAPQSTATPRRYSLYTPELNLLAETAMTTADSPSIAYEYIWFGGQPVAQVTTATNEIAWYFNDHLGTPVLQTDAAANVVWRVEREPYGTTYLLRTGADRHQPLSFPGQEEGVESDVAYNVFRWYRGGWRRYTQVDPFGLEGGLNLYSYGGGNPLSNIDPKGLAPAKTTPNCPCVNCPTGNWYQFGGNALRDVQLRWCGVSLYRFRCPSGKLQCDYLIVCGKGGVGMFAGLVAGGGITLFAYCPEELDGWSWTIDFDVPGGSGSAEPGSAGTLGVTVEGGTQSGAGSGINVCYAFRLGCKKY